ncbi:MAG: CDP-diacylglycerol--serine O-phosphatidyltransferase [Bryobacterales bacterium]|nr:CDP-diacylglycerol--serine O-phosphatidyltransferase [Bryobacterales bacterium]
MDLNLHQHLFERGPERRPKRAAYALPMLFTAGNVFLGFLAIARSFQGALLAMTGHLGHNEHFEVAAKAIGVAVLLDGLDGRIARLTRTTSEFGKEMDSLADVVSFGVAPACLALAWGAQFVDGPANRVVQEQLRGAAYFVAFLFLLCGAVRLARFNVQKNPVPKNPGRADRKYFVGLPIPAAAGLVAAVVYAADSAPLEFWPLSVAWVLLLALLAFLMVSTWRYRSLKDIHLLRPLSPLTVILWGALFWLVWNFSRPVLLTIAGYYVASGIVIRIGGAVRRRWRRLRPAPAA